ncbi:hypothetical protein CU097_015015 [Rhizopus azygosporus]|uniref:peptide chain release factor N(5)-glutamine methyltransferase n=1 Tax=Rhizopus azygosporus TaxID=86630 RepID=A0A367KF70_RHIAZ|nr:hypothetical protein CU097_015015 [Rhizopus azygosporus]
MNQSRWIQRLLVACDGDYNLASRHLFWLKEKVIEDSRGKRMSVRSNPLTSREEKHLEDLIKQRVSDHKPLQYILGTQPFCELDIVTRPPVLIPRWETEEWTDKTIRLLYPHLVKKGEKMRILDICTGTGCIALALSSRLPKDSVEIIGLDISEKAIELANHNLKVHQRKLKNPVRFQQGDVFDYSPSDKVHMIVSNPPYVTQDEYESLDPDVKNWEDMRALVADDQAFAADVPKVLMEIGGSHQVEPLTRTLKNNQLTNIQVWKDLAGKDRVIAAQ